jgi:hypothetical protein
VHVNELTARVSDAETEAGHCHGCDDNGRRDRTRNRRTSKNKDQRRQNQGCGGRPDELLGELFVLVQDPLWHDGFHAFLLGASGVDGQQAEPEEHGLKGNDGQPRPRADTAGPESPEESDRDEWHEHREPQRQVDDGGMQR